MQKRVRRTSVKGIARPRKDRRGPNNPNWKGGVSKLGNYHYVYKPGHPKAVYFGDTPYVLRATVNLEKKMGRFLQKGELPHHKNGNKTDDHPRNLVAKTKAAHNRLHSHGLSNDERRKIRQILERKYKS